MIKPPTVTRWGTVLLVLLTLGACTTPTKKPPTPKPLITEHPAQAGGGAASGGAHGGNGAGAPGSGQGYGAASATGADVQEEEVAADGSTRVLSSTPPAGGAAPAGRHGVGGGAPMAAGADAARRSGGGGNVEAVPVPAASTEMSGIHYRETSSSQGGVEDQGSSAARSGTPDGRDGGRGLSAGAKPAPTASAPPGRLGVRGGRDERGVSSGTPPPSDAPRPAHGAPVVQDNDVLARQLREAAEKETDPVLRDRLWAEYRKYKAGL